MPERELMDEKTDLCGIQARRSWYDSTDQVWCDLYHCLGHDCYSGKQDHKDTMDCHCHTGQSLRIRAQSHFNSWQICGLMVTQYHPDEGTAYPISTYMILLFQVFLSALSGVYNQALLKSDGSSLHADNMILYASGAAINLLLHLVIRVLKADEPGFFTGYGSIGACLVILSNVFIGLAITAVYKCRLSKTLVGQLLTENRCRCSYQMFRDSRSNRYTALPLSYSVWDRA